MAGGHLDSLLTLPATALLAPKQTSVCGYAHVCVVMHMYVWGRRGSGGDPWLFSSSETHWLGVHHDAHSTDEGR